MDTKKPLCLILAFLLIATMNAWMIQPVKASSGIIVDGDPSDWADIAPIISDPGGDVPYDVGDIKEVYVTQDENNLYFRIDIYGTISGTAGGYAIWLDTDQNPSTGVQGWVWAGFLDIGADYLINVFAGKPFLWKWIGPPQGWQTTILDLPEAYSGSVLETSVPLSAIDSPIAIDLVAWGAVLDVYPEDTYVTYVVGTNVASIIVDGYPADWGAISPVGTDATGDAPDPSMDITDCYVANDATGHIFVRMDIFGLMDPALDCIGYLDTDANPYTGVLYPWGVGVDDFAYAEDVGGTILEAKSSGTYSDGTTVHLFFLSEYVNEYWDFAPDMGHVTYPPPPPTVTISTDKETYSPGDTMSINITLRNPEVAVDVVFVWYLWLPGLPLPIRIVAIPLHLPAGYDKTFTIPLPIGEWGGTSFTAYWVVALLDPSSWTVIDWDYCVWTYQPTAGASTTPEVFAEQVAEAAKNKSLSIP